MKILNRIHKNYWKSDYFNQLQGKNCFPTACWSRDNTIPSFSRFFQQLILIFSKMQLFFFHFLLFISMVRFFTSWIKIKKEFKKQKLKIHFFWWNGYISWNYKSLKKKHASVLRDPLVAKRSKTTTYINCISGWFGLRFREKDPSFKKLIVRTFFYTHNGKVYVRVEINF